MKTIYGYISVLFAACLLQACDSNLDKAYYADSQTKAAVLEALPETFAIDKLQQDETALTFKWSAAEVGYSASITNTLEMDITGDSNFGDKTVTLASMVGDSASVSFTHKEFNNLVLSLLENYADENGAYSIGATSIQFRVTSSVSDAKSALVSNVVSSTITPYDNENTGYQAAAITSEVTNLTLSAENKTATALTLTWQKAYLGDDTDVSYAIQMNLPTTDAAYNYLKRTTVASVEEETSYDLTNQELNDALISLLGSYNKAVAETTVELSVAATASGYINALVSDPVELTLTPYVATTALTVASEMDLTATGTTEQTFSWDAVDGATYQLEMDLADASFSQFAVLGNNLSETSLTLSNDTISKAIKYLLMAHEDMTTTSGTKNIAFRVRAYYENAETALFSEAVTASVTFDNEEEEHSCYYFVGAYSNNWSFDNCLKLWQTEDKTYKAHIVCNNLTGGWKITDTAGWGGNNWGTNNSDGTVNTDGIMDINSANNVTAYGTNGNTSYTVEFNPNNGYLSMDNEEKSWMLLGDHNNFAFNDAAKMAIWYDTDNNQWYLKSNVEMEAGDTWYISSQIRNMKVTPADVSGHFEIDPDNSAKFAVSESGTYEIRWYFNEYTPCLIVLKTTTTEDSTTEDAGTTN